MDHIATFFCVITLATLRMVCADEGECYRGDLQHWEHLSLKTQRSTSSGGRLEVICEDGYSPNKEQPLCRNGIWSQNKEDLCIEKSCVVPFINHGFIASKCPPLPYLNLQNHKIPVGTTVPPRTRVLELCCEEPYTINGAVHQRKQVVCYKGNLVGYYKCEKKVFCFHPGGIPNGGAESFGQRTKGSFGEGGSVKYSCYAQYYLKGEKSLFCTEHSEWSAPVPMCIRGCSDLPTPTGGLITYIPPMNAVFQPRSPLYQSRDPTTRMLSKVQMTTFPEPANVTLPPGLQMQETIAMYECVSRYYELIGSKARRCHETGEWSGRHPVCMPVCGRSDSPRSPFIINGNATDIGQWPWQAGIARLMRGNFILECGASLISEDWVITAAHCVTHRGKTQTFDPDVFRIYVGKYHRAESEDDDHVQVRKVKVIHIPWEYHPIQFDADIALLKLDSPVQLNARVQPICLPTEQTSRENLVEGKKGVVTGWGMDENGKYSDTLQQAVLPVVSKANCEKGYKQIGRSLTVTENMYCAGYAEGRTDVCYGDSGGPMAFTAESSREHKWVLEGVVSWGSSRGCGKGNLYGGYTKVSKYLDWIHLYV